MVSRRASMEPNQTEKSSESSTEPRLPQGTKYHWICCKCGVPTFPRDEGGEEIYDFDLEDLKDCKCDDCEHAHCSDCKIGTSKGVDGGGVILSNWYKKIGAEIEKRENVMDLWRCCKCEEGPMDTVVEEQCRCYDCWHQKCELCMNGIGIKSVGEDGHTSWKLLGCRFPKGRSCAGQELLTIGDAWGWDNDGDSEANLGLDEEKLVSPEILPGSVPSEINNKARIGALKDVRGESLCPSTPGDTNGSTVSSVGSPSRLAEFESSEQSLAEVTLDSLVLAKKADGLTKMKLVLERRATKQGNSTKRPNRSLTAGEKFESCTSLVSDPFEFLIIWEHSILPFLVEFMPVWVGPGYTISLRRGSGPALKVISIMTDESTTLFQQLMVQRHVLDILPEKFKDSTSFDFRMGTIKKLAFDLDDICDPRNPYYYCNPTMGDSVGISIGQGDDRSTSTLGPCVVIGDEFFWLINFHPLQDAANTREQGAFNLTLQHPSPDDQLICMLSGHEMFKYHQPDLTLGQVALTAGIDHKTTRLSNNPYWAEVDLEDQHIVVDWALCSASSPHTNILRMPVEVGRTPVTAITTISNSMWGAPVHSTGRTSGFQHGSICMSPALISAKINGTGRDTREWFVEEPYPYDNEAGWTESGIGLSGDSGAAIVDDESNVLYGHLWGRNKYHKSGVGPRITFFTPISDVFDDIQEKFSGSPRPELAPHNGCEIYYTELPTCSECLREHQNKYVTASRSPVLEAMIRPEEMTPPGEELLTPETVRSPDIRRQEALVSCYVGSQDTDCWPDTRTSQFDGELDPSGMIAPGDQDGGSQVFFKTEDQEGLCDVKGKRKLPNDSPETFSKSRKRCY